ncbi:MAG: tetratricopeptide repeat protein [Hungatella sp.]
MNNVRKTAVTLLILIMMLTGCGRSTQKYTDRETGIEKLSAGNYEEAIESFDQALEHSNGMVSEFELDVLKYRAEAEYQIEDYKAAAHTYDVLIQVDGEKPEYLNMRCMLSMKAGNLEQALEDYQKSYALNPGTAVTEPALLSLGQALTEADRFDEAMEFYNQAAGDGLKSSELYNRMGICEMKNANLDQALDYFTKGISAGDPAVLPKLLYNQAAVYEQKQDYAKALELLEFYVASYEATPEVEKEIAFLKTR